MKKKLVKIIPVIVFLFANNLLCNENNGNFIVFTTENTGKTMISEEEMEKYGINNEKSNNQYSFYNKNIKQEIKEQYIEQNNDDDDDELNNEQLSTQQQYIEQNNDDELNNEQLSTQQQYTEQNNYKEIPENNEMITEDIKNLSPKKIEENNNIIYDSEQAKQTLNIENNNVEITTDETVEPMMEEKREIKTLFEGVNTNLNKTTTLKTKITINKN